MSLSLPADPPAARSLTDVLPQSLAALEGRSTWFPRVRSAIVIVIDGLGRQNLTSRAGHARFLSGRMTRADALRTVFPSTTAAALTGLLTGRSAGEHGIVGYRARVPGSDRVPNQLKGWETDGLDPLTWQRCDPLTETEAARGRPFFVVSKEMYARTGFTRAVQRGATFVGAETVEDRLRRAARLATDHDGAMVYVYAPELDTIGHSLGWESDRWTVALEHLDRAVADLDATLPADVGGLLTADHGMVDVPAHRQILLTGGDEVLDGVALIGGEPRMLHLYADAGAASDVAERWRAREGGRSWVITRDEAVDAGLFGAVVDSTVLPRIGDVLVAARSAVAYYDDRLADKKPQRMIGQHGSLTDQERIVPLVRLGGFAR